MSSNNGLRRAHTNLFNSAKKMGGLGAESEQKIVIKCKSYVVRRGRGKDGPLDGPGTYIVSTMPHPSDSHALSRHLIGWKPD